MRRGKEGRRGRGEDRCKEGEGGEDRCEEGQGGKERKGEGR